MKKLSALLALVLLFSALGSFACAEETTDLMAFDPAIYPVLLFLEKGLPYPEGLALMESKESPPVSVTIENRWMTQLPLVDTPIGPAAMISSQMLTEGFEEAILVETRVLAAYSDHVALYLRFVHPDESVRQQEMLCFFSDEAAEGESAEAQNTFLLESCQLLFKSRAGTEDWAGSWAIPVDLEGIREIRESWEMDLKILGDISLTDYLQSVFHN